MIKDSEFGADFLGTFSTLGGKTAETASQIANISLEATKQAMHAQLGLASFLVGTSGEQLCSLGLIASPAAFLQRQKEFGDALGEKLHDHVETLRGIGVEAQSAVAEAARSLAAEFGLKPA